MSVHGCRKESYRNPSRYFREKILASQTFGSFPYLSTRVFPALYNINLYPSGWTEPDLIELARHQVAANKLPACLVLSWNRGLWFDGYGSETSNSFIPKGGAILDGRLKPPHGYALVDDSDERSDLLAEFSSSSLRGGGYLVGDPENCVREATPEDVKLGELKGNIIPHGLTECPDCGALKGECFYPESACYSEKVWNVSCLCDNDNLCAGCGEPLANHKLDSCYVDRESLSIMHVAGYYALNHQCNQSGEIS
jgi:hypothetical protein